MSGSPGNRDLRRARLADGARALPVLGAAAVFGTLLWAGRSTVGISLWLGGVWLLMILGAVAIARARR